MIKITRQRLKIISAVFSAVVAVIIAVTYYMLQTDCLALGSVVYIVLVYGQSLALGEETTLVTDIDDYGAKTQHRVKSEFLNERIGYYADKLWKQRLKSVFRHENRHFETSVFGLGECFVKLNPDSKMYLCTFPAGQGETQLSLLCKGTKPYNKFIEEIRMVYDKAAAQGAKVVMPAFCWMQGENDLVWDTKYDYASLLKKFRIDVEHDVKDITHQQQSVNCILYQTNSLTLTKDKMNPNSYVCRQVSVTEQQRQLIMHDKHFFASGPVYPYNVVRNYVHIDAFGQKQMGYLEGLSLHHLMHGEKFIGLQPKTVFRHGDTLIIKMHVPVPPLIIDTITVTKAPHYGFSVITSTNQNVLKDVKISDNQVYLICSHSLTNQVEVVNGDYMKSGKAFGPCGNLRDSQGSSISCTIGTKRHPLNNWCYIFELIN